MSPPHAPTNPAGPSSQMSSSHTPGLDRLVPFHPPPGLPSQMSSSHTPGLDRLVPFHPPPGLPHPPTRLPLYGYPTRDQYQTHPAAGIGMNVPHYFPQYPPFSQHGNAGAWGYGPPASGPIPGALPHFGSLQPAQPAPAPVPPVAVHTEWAGAAGQVATYPPPPPPRRAYPNKQIKDGGESRSIEKTHD
jgi:hypothetical protein